MNFKHLVEVFLVVAMFFVVIQAVRLARWPFRVAFMLALVLYVWLA